MKRITIYLGAVALVFSLLPTSGVAQEREIETVCFLPKNHPLATMTLEWVRRVNVYCQGELSVKYLGGPEVIPALEQVEALRKNAVQVVFGSAASYQSIFPEGVAFTLSKLTPWEERIPGGFYDFMVERHKRINITYVGRWLHGPFSIWLKEPVETPQDLKGRRLGTQDLHDRFLKALGAVPVRVSISETRAALKDGKMDGASSPLMGVRERGWAETCKYIIVHPLYNQDCTILMNLDIWNSFPETLQEKITSITAWFEPYMVGYFDGLIEMERKELERIGVKNIRFSPPDAESYLNAAYEVEWDALKEKAPDLLLQLRELTEY